MQLIQRYIAKAIFSSIGLVTLLLMGVQLFLLFVGQLEQLGTGNYGIVAALTYVLLQMPYQVYLFFPIASLLGCLVGLGLMANHRELVVMRASGMSVWQITYTVIKIALVLILLVTMLGETLIPKMVRMSNNVKVDAQSGGQAVRTSRGIWTRQGNDFIHIFSIQSDNTLLYVDQFRFDDHHRLILARTIKRLYYTDNVWHADGVSETLIARDHTSGRHVSRMKWDVPLNPAIISISSSEPDEMSLGALYRYNRLQHANHQLALNYELAYWQRVMQPLTTVVMMILAIPFIFGPLRSSTMGSKLLMGAMVGFGFYIANRFLGSMSQVFQLSPAVAAMMPTLIFAMLGVYLMRRVK